MTKYRINISAKKLAAILGLPGIGWPRILALHAVADWIKRSVYEGHIPELNDGVGYGTDINIEWDEDSRSIYFWTDELDEESILRLRQRLVCAMGDAFLHGGRKVVRQPSLNDIEAIPLPVNQGA